MNPNSHSGNLIFLLLSAYFGLLSNSCVPFTDIEHSTQKVISINCYSFFLTWQKKTFSGTAVDNQYPTGYQLIHFSILQSFTTDYVRRYSYHKAAISTFEINTKCRSNSHTHHLQWDWPCYLNTLFLLYKSQNSHGGNSISIKNHLYFYCFQFQDLASYIQYSSLSIL